MRTLHIDAEGGWGGSSRSLFELLVRLRPLGVEPLVILRKPGPMQERYSAAGIRCMHLPGIASYVPRPGISWADLVKAAPDLLRADRVTKRIAGIGREHGAKLVHLNYEGLAPYVAGLKRHLDVPLIQHVRASNLAEDLPARWLASCMAKSDYLFFISPMEEAWFRRVARHYRIPDSSILWNIAPAPLPRKEPEDGVPRIVYLGSLDPTKGTDQLVDLAAALEACNAPPARIVAYGVARRKQGYEHELMAEVGRRGASARFALGGYVQNPMEALASAFALVRPSRLNDPWGRDVIEAAVAGVPVLATGSYDGVVVPGRTGWLFPRFDAAAMAERLKYLLCDRNLHTRVATDSAAIGLSRFGGEQQVGQAESVLRRLAG